MEKLDVIASFDWMDKEEKIGTLGHESNQQHVSSIVGRCQFKRLFFRSPF